MRAPNGKTINASTEEAMKQTKEEEIAGLEETTKQMTEMKM